MLTALCLLLDGNRWVLDNSDQFRQEGDFASSGIFGICMFGSLMHCGHKQTWKQMFRFWCISQKTNISSTPGG
jgi:hypothetical protein